MGKVAKEIEGATNSFYKKVVPREVRKVLPKEIIYNPVLSPMSFLFPQKPEVPVSGGGEHGMLLPEGPQMPSFQFDMPSMDLASINQGTPSAVGRLDVIGVRSRRSRGTSALRNDFSISAAQAGSVRAAAARAGLNLPT